MQEEQRHTSTGPDDVEVNVAHAVSLEAVTAIPPALIPRAHSRGRANTAHHRAHRGAPSQGSRFQGVSSAARRLAAPVSVGAVTVIKINAITTAADSGDALAERFAARVGSVDGQDGFEGFELLKPTDERTTWLVVTRWRDEAAFEGWVASPAFVAGHQRTAGGGTDGGQKPVGVSSELWSYEIAGGSAR